MVMVRLKKQGRNKWIMSLTSRERVRRVLRRELPDRVPFNFWMDRDAMQRYDELLGDSFRISYYDADIIEVFPSIPWWQDLQVKTRRLSGTNWQLRPLVDSIEFSKELVLPDPNHVEYYDCIQNMRKRYPDKAIFVNILGPLDHAFALRLYEGVFLDMFDHPDALERFLMSVGDVVAEIVRYVCTLDVDAIYLMGDVCDNNGPMMSMELLRRFWLRPLERAIDTAKSTGFPVLYHTDGNVSKLLDLFVEARIDGINPLQYDVNDLEYFARYYGDRLLVYGGIDNRQIIPNGTFSDITRHIEYLFETLGRTGGLILSSHDIPGDTPKANLDMMVSIIKRCCY